MLSGPSPQIRKISDHQESGSDLPSHSSENRGQAIFQHSEILEAIGKNQLPKALIKIITEQLASSGKIDVNVERSLLNAMLEGLGRTDHPYAGTAVELLRLREESSLPDGSIYRTREISSDRTPSRRFIGTLDLDTINGAFSASEELPDPLSAYLAKTISA